MFAQNKTFGCSHEAPSPSLFPPIQIEIASKCSSAEATRAFEYCIKADSAWGCTEIVGTDLIAKRANPPQQLKLC